MSSNKSYSELIKIPDYKDRFDYLKLNGSVGNLTFGSKRYLNQVFYKSKEWADVRNSVITRDNGCDLAFPGYDIFGSILVHHLNPITEFDISNHSDKLLDTDQLVCVTLSTHNAIHYGDSNLLTLDPIVRTKNDTCPWKGRI